MHMAYVWLLNEPQLMLLAMNRARAYMHMAYVWLLNEPQLVLLAVNRAHAYMHMAYVWLLNEPHVHVHTELMVSLFIGCTMRCEIWAQPAELPR